MRAGQSDINAATMPLPDGYTSGVVDHNGGAVREVGTNSATPGDRFPKPLTQTDVTIIHSFHMFKFFVTTIFKQLSVSRSDGQ